jgi:CubicO group peptidase (beta-lactamase class C family)
MRTLLCGIALAACTTAVAQPLPVATPESAGFSREGIARIWNGANGKLFWGDPKEKLTVVVGTAGPGEIRKYYREQMGALVYGAMTRSNVAR